MATKQKRAWLFPLAGTITMAFLAAMNAAYGLEKWVVGFGLVMGVVGWACLTALIKRFS
ncbi:TPA: hypothetical protein L4R50_000367 [Pseudomonas aeruginosa]|nr:hypothetical protein [Pseudomonas aeruginosa]